MTITEDLHMLLYVALGGALGSVGRYLVAGSLKGVGGTDFPWHMIAVNTLGCILVGFLWLYYTLNCRILVGSTSFIGDSLEVLQPFLHLSKKECIFSCMGSILRDSFIFSCRTCLVCLLPVPLFGWARCCFKDDRGSFVRGDGSEYQYVFLIVTALGLVGSTFSWGMYRTGFSLLHSAWTLLPFLLMPLIFAIGNIFTESLPVTLIRYFSWSGGVWMGFIFYSVLLSIFYGVCWLLGRFSQSPNLAPNAAITIFSSLFGDRSWRLPGPSSPCAADHPSHV